MPTNTLYLLTLIPITLLAMTAFRGYRAWQGQQQDALTIEEGLDTIKQRMTARDALQMLLVVAIVSVLSVAIALMALHLWRQPALSNAMYLALMIVGSGFLLIPWYRRASDATAVQMLDQDAGPGGGQGNLRRLMRTYLYYNSDPSAQKPGLFDWIRRQLGLYILGLDMQAHIPFSRTSIAKQSSIMMLCVALLAVLLAFLGKPPKEFEYQFAEGTTATEIENESEYRGAPDPEGDTEAPQYGADNEDPSQSQQDNAPAPEQEPESPDDEEVPVPEDPPAEKPDPGDTGSGEDPGETDTLMDQLVAGLLDMFRDDKPGQDEATPTPPDTSFANPGLAQGPSEDSAAMGEAPDTMAGTGDQEKQQQTSSPGSGNTGQTDDPSSTSDNPDAPPSDESAGGSQQARVSRGGGGGVMGVATDVPTDLAPNARSLELKVDSATREDPGKESEQSARPQRLNAQLELKPEDVTVTPADPLVTQRIPRSYEKTIRKLLSKP